jgi:dTDP-4-dehydrorhamnose reductase
MNILMTGGSGLLGKELQKLDSTIVAPIHDELDVTDLSSIETAIKKYKPDVVLHLAAATEPPEHEKNPEPGLMVNILGTAQICLACHKAGIKLVYASTDYVYTGEGPHTENEALLPPSRFAWSKLGGECAVRMLQKFLILRLSFGPIPFPWEKVYTDQYVSKLYVDEMARLVLQAAKSKAEGVMNLGGPRISLEAYARKTRSDIKTIPKPDWVPEDTSMDITKMKKEFKL